MERVEKFVNEKEAAKLMSLSVGTLRNQRWKRCGVPYAKLGKSVRYSVQAIMEYMNAHTIEVDPQ